MAERVPNLIGYGQQTLNWKTFKRATQTHCSQTVQSQRQNCESIKDEAICHREVLFNKIYNQSENPESRRMTDIKCQRKKPSTKKSCIWQNCSLNSLKKEGNSDIYYNMDES